MNDSPCIAFILILQKAFAQKRALSASGGATAISQPDPGETTAGSQSVHSDSCDNWRMVMSGKLNRVFYFNVKTKIGQWEVPDVFVGSDEVPAWEDRDESEGIPQPPIEEVRTEDAFNNHI